jgi:hypothetical protein
MFKVIIARLKQGHRTMKFPAGAPPEMPDRYKGRPEILKSILPVPLQIPTVIPWPHPSHFASVTRMLLRVA